MSKKQQLIRLFLVKTTVKFSKMMKPLDCQDCLDCMHFVKTRYQLTATYTLHTSADTEYRHGAIGVHSGCVTFNFFIVF